MYRTLDTYNIKPSSLIHWHMVEKFNKASCTYRNYKKFFLAFYQAFGPFSAEVSFNEDYHPEECGYNTTVNFGVDGDGNYVFALVNVLAAGESEKTSQEYEKRRTNPQPPFEPNCKKEGNIHDWHKPE
jgi:hypothetical protein